MTPFPTNVRPHPEHLNLCVPRDVQPKRTYSVRPQIGHDPSTSEIIIFSLSPPTLLLVIAGFVYVAEALSVIIQVTSFKLTGKRVFRMSPLHHHFEMGGMKETQVVLMFWGASLVLCLIAYAVFRI